MGLSHRPFPLYAIEHGVTNPGIFFTTFAIILILCRTLGSELLDRYSREMVILPCLINYILTTLLLAFSHTLPMFILVAVIWGVGTAFLFPALVALTLDLAGSARGLAIGTFTAFSDLGVGLGAVMMGIVIRWTNYQVMFFCLAFIGFVNVLYFNFLVRRRRFDNRRKLSRDFKSKLKHFPSRERRHSSPIKKKNEPETRKYLQTIQQPRPPWGLVAISVI